MAATYRNPALTTDAVWIRAGRVLLVRRGQPPFRGLWALPGGFVELRETVEESVVRELFEETGLRARPSKLIGVYSGPDRDPRKPTTTVAFLMRGRGGNPRGGDDAEAAAWVPIGEVGPLAFDHAEILRDALRAGSYGATARGARPGRRPKAPGRRARATPGTRKARRLRQGSPRSRRARRGSR